MTCIPAACRRGSHGRHSQLQEEQDEDEAWHRVRVALGGRQQLKNG
eukprot:CAMPEP_0114156686 /NCGR_PEP_ID=MMETSP0043_2-20121206/26192_1 /TAXON_ID=464988 /ORGANISM="Hemiselmis andersenii, Strain CCMP644" /LENGTH=45 /DNA_ID= /DNA_START= /DNA_END= /DNA_ORIENTATION=